MILTSGEQREVRDVSYNVEDSFCDKYRNCLAPNGGNAKVEKPVVDC